MKRLGRNEDDLKMARTPRARTLAEGRLTCAFKHLPMDRAGFVHRGKYRGEVKEGGRVGGWGSQGENRGNGGHRPAGGQRLGDRLGSAQRRRTDSEPAARSRSREETGRGPQRGAR